MATATTENKTGAAESRARKPKGLLARLHRAQKIAKPVAKKGDNKAQGYSFARAEDVISEAGRVLQNEGLVALMAFTEMDEREITSKGGGSGMYVRLRAELRIIEPESGEVLTVEGFGSGVDYPGDKAVYKAMTGAAKYAYSSALAMPFGDDPEHDRGMPAGEAGGPSKPSDKQIGFFNKLVSEKAGSGADEQHVLLIQAWGAATLTGGRAGSMSKAIEGLKEEPDETLLRLLKAAQAWESTRPMEPPPDTTDLPEADAEDQGTILLSGPWTFEQAAEKLRAASMAQQQVEELLRENYSAFAIAEEHYRKALAQEIVGSHNDGVAWTAAADLARGDARVAELRRQRDIAEGMKEAVVQAGWRRAADRRDAQRFADWSMRRELAEFHGETPAEALG